MRNSYPQSLDILLKKNNLNSNILKTIQQHTNALIKLNHSVASILPIELNSWCRVINYRQHILILEVSSANRKARLNYELTTLFLRLRNSILPLLSSIKIIINPSLSYKNLKNCSLVHGMAIKSSKHIINKLSKESAKTIYNLSIKSPKKLKEKLENLVILA
ncbi:MAG: DUF721 domain-containing protein [Arsenophonus sp.]